MALIEQTSKCLAFLDKVFVDIASFWPRHDASFFASFIYKVMSRRGRTFELNFVHFILTPFGCIVHSDQCKKNMLATVAFLCVSFASEMNCSKLGELLFTEDWRITMFVYR